MTWFAQGPRDGDEVYASAVSRLGEARDEQRRLVDQLALAAGTGAESRAARELAAGRAEVTVREAWLVCVERGV
jgi:hypothetical protein